MTDPMSAKATEEQQERVERSQFRRIVEKREEAKMAYNRALAAAHRKGFAEGREAGRRA